ncbi:MAG: SDR family oxidoreductase [Selenomonadaceae bacterium]|nr:SDR family oxidoreductase [Selenomonadaceae bacterium]
MNVEFNFSGQNFLVTGASSGIGREVARELLEAGAKVFGVARHFPEPDELEKFGQAWQPRILDVTQFDAVEKIVAEFVEAHGKLDGVVHSAGAALLLPVNVWDFDAASKLMDVNFFAVANLVKIFCRKKYRAESFAQVLVSSVSAHKAQKSLASYAATKSAAEMYLRTAALELAGKNIRLNSVTLGWISNTKMTAAADSEIPDVARGTVEDAAGVILFLLSDRAKFITGANFTVDGGFL